MHIYTDRDYLIAEMKRLDAKYWECVHAYEADRSHANFIKVENAQAEFNSAFTRFVNLDDEIV